MAVKGRKPVYTVLYSVTALMVILFLAKKYTELKETNMYLHMYAEDLSRVKKQRDLLSKTLNDAKKFLGQKRCNERKIFNKNIGGSGVRCSKENRLLFDATLAEALGYLLLRQRVAIVGEGPGLYKKYFNQQGDVAICDAYDGDPFVENATAGKVNYMELTVPQYGLPVYDWVVCLEAAEYVPRQFEDVFVSNIVRHARVGVLLSWAEPDEKDFIDINSKSHEDLDQIMFKNGFDLNEKASDLLRRMATLPRFQENIRVYERQLISHINDNEY